jgi:ribose 5-phosphate isomerase A
VSVDIRLASYARVRLGWDAGTVTVEDEKRLAAEAAAELVGDGMTIGLGTGSTVGYFLAAIARRGLRLRCVATSPRTEASARELGLSVEAFDTLDRLDLAVDGADQVASDGWVVKGGGGAHTREKVVAAAADRFVVIVSSDKLVDAVEPPVPLEILAYGVAATLARIAPAELREAAVSPDGGLLADYLGPVGEPGELAARLAATPGVVEHGLFPPELVAEVLVARDTEVIRRTR